MPREGNVNLTCIRTNRRATPAITTEYQLKFVDITFAAVGPRPSTPNFSQRASGMDLDVCGLVSKLKQDQMQLKLNIARPLAHTRCSHQRKKSVIARSLFASSCRMRASGLRLEGSVVNGFDVPCGSQSKRVIVYSGAWTDCG